MEQIEEWDCENRNQFLEIWCEAGQKAMDKLYWIERVLSGILVLNGDSWVIFTHKWGESISLGGWTYMKEKVGKRWDQSPGGIN